MGVADVKVDFNIAIPMTKAENPVGYNCNIYASAFYHTSPYNGTGSIKRPTIFLATGYHRDLIGLMFAVIAFVPHDYNVVVLDMRGTGSGEGVWDPLSPIEQYDVAYMIDKWIPAQPWSDGTVGMVGGSYMGIIQYLAAGLVEQVNGTPTHLKAIAPISAYNDVWKDIVWHGGNFDLEFMAIWILMTDFISILPPDLIVGGVAEPNFNKTDFMNALSIWAQHFKQLTVPLEYYAALWPTQFAEEQEHRAKQKEEELRRNEEKKRAAAAKAQAKELVARCAQSNRGFIVAVELAIERN